MEIKYSGVIPSDSEPTEAFETREILEAVVMRPQGGDDTKVPEIYMWLRPTDDPFFPGQWTVLSERYRHNDTAGDVALRLMNKFDVEIEDIAHVGLKFYELPTETFFSNVHLVQLAEPVLVDNQHKWWKMDELPPTIAPFHRDQILPLALKAYNNGRPRNSG